jgi:hypothetical protein
MGHFLFGAKVLLTTIHEGNFVVHHSISLLLDKHE